MKSCDSPGSGLGSEFILQRQNFCNSQWILAKWIEDDSAIRLFLEVDLAKNIINMWSWDETLIGEIQKLF